MSWSHEAVSINSTGQVIGIYSNGTPNQEGFLYSNGTYTDLIDPSQSTIGDTIPGTPPRLTYGAT